MFKTSLCRINYLFYYVLILIIIFYYRLLVSLNRNYLEKCSYELEKKTNYSNLIDTRILEFNEIKNNLLKQSIRLELGGKSYTHVNNKCQSDDFSFKRIAFIIPYRDRLNNLKAFLNNIHKFLVNKKLNYGIYLIEPREGIKFNRGLLMNIGFIESIRDKINFEYNINATIEYLENIKDSYWDCWIFHDVDMIPEDERLEYTCGKFPLHFAAAVKKFNYNSQGLMKDYFGGISSFTKEQFLKVNGFSNLYFGWGSEDDDIRLRAIEILKNVERVSDKIARIYTFDHEQDKENPERFKIKEKNYKSLQQNKKAIEGLSTLNYEVESVHKEFLFTKIHVNYEEKSYFGQK